MNIYNSSIKALPEPTYSQVIRNKRNSSSQTTPSPPTPTPTPLPPANYTPTGYDFNFVNFGLPHYEGNYQYYNLINPIVWSPKTLILAMNNLHVLKVGLQYEEINHINSVVYEMHRAMPSVHYKLDLKYLTHNSLIYMKIGEGTNVQLIQDEYICMAPTSILNHWPTSSLKTKAMQVSITGFRRCCGALEPTFHMKSMMIEECDSYDEGYSDIISIL